MDLVALRDLEHVLVTVALAAPRARAGLCLVEPQGDDVLTARAAIGVVGALAPLAAALERVPAAIEPPASLGSERRGSPETPSEAADGGETRPTRWRRLLYGG